MNRTTGRRWIAAAACSVVLLALGSVAFPETSRVGVLFAEHTPGRPSTAGTPVMAGELVKATSRGALLRLDNGNLLRFRANSAAQIDDAGAGLVEVTVLSGRLAAVDENGALLLAGQRSRFTLASGAPDGSVAERRLLEADLERSGRPAEVGPASGAAR